METTVSRDAILLANGEMFTPDDAQIDSLQKINPAIDVRREMIACARWTVDNPKNRKVNGPRFFSNWCKQAQDRAERRERFKVEDEKKETAKQRGEAMSADEFRHLRGGDDVMRHKLLGVPFDSPQTFRINLASIADHIVAQLRPRYREDEKHHFESACYGTMHWEVQRAFHPEMVYPRNK